VDAAGCRQRLKHTRVHWTSTVSHSTWPYGPSPQPGTGEQLPLFQLYPLLVHAVLFGAGYRAQAEAVARRFT
jgi:hypothetical protein